MGTCCSCCGSKHSIVATKPRDAPDDNFPHYFQNESGLWIHWREWHPLVHEVKGVVFISIGIGEHTDRYDGFATHLTSNGYICFSVDHQGQGLSDGDRIYVEKFDHYLNDFQQFYNTVMRKYPHLIQLPRILFGHSLGGLIALRLLQRDRQPWSGVILSAPAIVPSPDVATPAIRRVTTILSSLTPKLRLRGFPITSISTNPAVVTLAQNDHLFVKAPICARTGFELMSVMDAVWSDVGSCNVPLLLLHGTHDTLVMISGSERLINEYPCIDKSFIRYEGLGHELVTETRRHEVMRDIDLFLTRRTSRVDVAPHA